MLKCRCMEGKTRVPYLMLICAFFAKNGRKGWETKMSNVAISFIYSYISSICHIDI
jgi:hypothetical protein